MDIVGSRYTDLPVYLLNLSTIHSHNINFENTGTKGLMCIIVSEPLYNYIEQTGVSQQDA